METSEPPAMWSLDDYRARLVRALDTIDELIDGALNGPEWDRSDTAARRLSAKREGVSLALSYFDEMQREPGVGVEPTTWSLRVTRSTTEPTGRETGE